VQKSCTLKNQEKKLSKKNLVFESSILNVQKSCTLKNQKKKSSKKNRVLKVDFSMCKKVAH